MRFLFLALLLVVGILCAVVLMQKGQARIVAETAQPATATPQVSPNEPAALPGQATPAPTERLPGNPAAATAEVQSQSSAPVGAAPLAPETPPAGEAAGEKPSPGKPAKPAAPAFQIIAKPAIVAAGILETTRGRVTLKDIAPMDAATLCGTGASAWPCGQLALTQFRRFLRGRAVNCDIADPAWQGEVTARCTLGKEDLAAWLVENGWARAATGSPYEEAARAAEAGKRGIFGPDPRHP